MSRRLRGGIVGAGESIHAVTFFAVFPLLRAPLKRMFVIKRPPFSVRRGRLFTQLLLLSQSEVLRLLVALQDRAVDCRVVLRIGAARQQQGH